MSAAPSLLYRSNKEGREELGAGAGGPRPNRQALRLHAAAVAKERERDPLGECVGGCVLCSCVL